MCSLAAPRTMPAQASGDSGLSSTSPGERLAESRRLQRESILAHRAGDFATFRVKNDSALALRSDHPSLVYNGAAGAALAGDTAAAIAFLDRLADWGLAYDPGEDPDFTGLQGAPGFAAVRERLRGNRAPYGRAERAFVFPGRE